MAPEIVGMAEARVPVVRFASAIPTMLGTTAGLADLLANLFDHYAPFGRMRGCL